MPFQPLPKLMHSVEEVQRKQLLASEKQNISTFHTNTDFSYPFLLANVSYTEGIHYIIYLLVTFLLNLINILIISSKSF